MMADLKQQPACAAQTYQITSQALPLSCPTAQMPLWNAHPRVFLPIKATGTAVCPYCNAQFTLIEDEKT